MPSPTSYFAYSVLLDPETFDRRMKEGGHPTFRLPEGKVGEAQDVELVFNFHSPRWGGRIASLVPMPGHSVFGRVLPLKDSDFAILRDAEGAKSGSFQELNVQVKVDGKLVPAVAFATAPGRATTSGPVSESYASALARGAEAAGLPRAYWEKLKAEAAILAKVQSVGRELNLK
ncbi:MAG TPA: gamma-glutamylcyclotransferase [Myxococcales bacterium]|nr:gamma-glutamylcyclotransferase [Myxococcales bacterium]